MTTHTIEYNTGLNKNISFSNHLHTIKKIFTLLVFAASICFALFAFMAYLVKNDDIGAIKDDRPTLNTIMQTPPDPKVDHIERHKLTPPPLPKPIPKMMATPDATEETTDYNFQPTPIKIIGNNSATTNFTPPDTDARPIVRINPKYPIVAAREGKEGWVKLSFNINEIGAVTNVKVIDSQPKRIFDKAAKQALKKWKYKAKTIDGKAVMQQNLTVQLDFTMEKQQG